MEPLGASDRHRGLIKDSSDMAHRVVCDFLLFRRSGSTVWIAIGPSTLLTLHRTIQTFRGKLHPHDRGLIEPRSWSVRRGITSTGSDGDLWRIKTTIDARSWPDRGAIMAPLSQKSRLIHHLIGSHDVAK